MLIVSSWRSDVDKCLFCKSLSVAVYFSGGSCSRVLTERERGLDDSESQWLDHPCIIFSWGRLRWCSAPIIEYLKGLNYWVKTTDWLYQVSENHFFIFLFLCKKVAKVVSNMFCDHSLLLFIIQLDCTNSTKGKQKNRVQATIGHLISVWFKSTYTIPWV